MAYYLWGNMRMQCILLRKKTDYGRITNSKCLEYPALEHKRNLGYLEDHCSVLTNQKL